MAHRVLRPLKTPEMRQREDVEFRSSESIGRNRVNKDPSEEFRERLAKRGFVIDNIGMDEIVRDLATSHELRDMALRPDEDAAMEIDGEPVESPSQVLYVGKNFFRLWAPDVVQREREKFNRRQLMFPGKFPGNKSQMDLLMSSILPSSLALKPGHLSVDQLPEIAALAHKCGIHGVETEDGKGNVTLKDWIQDATAYFLSESVEVPACAKLKLASLTGNELLLEATLHTQCGKREAIQEIVENRKIYDEICGGPKAVPVMKRMLEHQTKCEASDYLTTLKDAYTKLTKETKERCKEIIDFRDPNWLQNHCGGENECRSVRSVCLSVGENKLYASRWCLASWSPVFYRMLYGDFVEGSSSTVIPLDEEYTGDNDSGSSVTLIGVIRFLNLLHPSAMWALWYLLPSEKAGYWQDPVLADLFDILFDHNLDLLTEVFRLAHKFQVNSLLEFCVMMIEVNSDFQLTERILLADGYHLPRMMARCLDKMTTARGVKRIMLEQQSFLDDLSCPTHKLIMERLLELV